MPKLAYDPQTGEIDWKKSDLVYPEHAVHYLIRGREERLARGRGALSSEGEPGEEVKELPAMLTLALPNGTHMDFENAEALELALHRMREGKPIVVCDEKDGGLETLWAPEDGRHH
jgi:hypothetical protein